MKIAINARHLLKDNLEGVGWYTFEMIRFWAKTHADDRFYLLFDRPYAQEFIMNNNIIPVVIAPPARHPLLFIWWFEIGVNRTLKQINPDVYFSPDGFMPLSSSVPAVITIHDVAHRAFPGHIPFFMRGYYHFFIPRFLKKARAIVTVSNFSKAEIIKYFDTPAAKITVIYNACREVFKPASFFTEIDIPGIIGIQEPYILYVGSIHPRKNLPVLIQAFELLKSRGFRHHLLIIGRLAWKRGEFTKILGRTPSRTAIHHLQKIPDQTLAAIMAHASVLVYPSMYEGFGFPLLEGMHAEVPVIAARSSSLTEIGGDAVLYFEPNEPGVLCELLEKTITDQQVRKTLTEKSKIQRTKFDWMKSSLQLYHILKSEIPITP